MKKTKVILTLVCAVLLVAASVMGTLAYLTATTDEVKNTFTVGSVSFKTGAGLDEAAVNEYGQKLNDKGGVYDPENKDDVLADRVQEGSYKLIPGHNYVKDPTVHMSDSTEDAYLFVTVDNQITAIEADTTIAAQMAAKGWVAVEDNGGKVVAYIWYGTTTTTGDDGTTTTKVNESKTVVTKNQDIVVFDEFTVKGDAKVADYAGKTITIKAYAIQADGLESVTDYNLWLKASGSAT